MLSDNIKMLRKKNGYSQETLADQLHVVRQTISKWEKGISVPDAVMLERMAELFDVPVSVLLGGGPEVEEEQPSELNEIAQQLALLNDQLVQQAVRRRKVIRYAFVGVFAAIFGEYEGYREERYYTDFTENSFAAFIKDFSEIKIVEYWISKDVRPGRSEEKWLNLILQKSDIV